MPHHKQKRSPKIEFGIDYGTRHHCGLPGICIGVYTNSATFRCFRCGKNWNLAGLGTKAVSHLRESLEEGLEYVRITVLRKERKPARAD